VRLLAFSHGTGVRVAEVAFLLFVIAAYGGLLLIVATHWGHPFSLVVGNLA
jgi:hypothetical protein